MASEADRITNRLIVRPASLTARATATCVHRLLKLCFVLLYAFQSPALALDLADMFSPGPWGLPASLSNKNTAIRYEVDASIHQVKGSVEALSGTVWLAVKGDPSSVRAAIEFDLKNMNSGNESRDSRMRGALHYANAPKVTLNVTSATLPKPESIPKSEERQGELRGNIVIAGISHPITLPISITKMEDGFKIYGTHSLSWRSFGMDDPSTLIATVKDPVQITFEVTLTR